MLADFSHLCALCVDIVTALRHDVLTMQGKTNRTRLPRRQVLGPAANLRTVRRLEREWRASVAREERCDDLEASWKLAAKSDRAMVRLTAARNGEVVAVPRTARNLAKGAMVALATIGRVVARALNAAKGLARSAAARAAKVAAKSARRAVAAIASSAVVVAALTTITATASDSSDSWVTDRAADIAAERQETMTIKSTLNLTARKGPRSAGSRQVVTTMKVTAFFRTFNRVPERMRTKTVEFTAPVGTAIEDLIEMAHAAGASRGARTPSGVFEIQTDEGIWSTPDETKLLTTSNSGLSDRASFKSWKAMEREERAEARAAAKAVVS